MGVYLHRGFHDNKDVVYLQMEKGQVTKQTTSVDFTGRILVSHSPLVEGGHAFTWQLSQLRLEDTNWYYCKWLYPESKTLVTDTSIGTIIVVRGRERRSQHSNMELHLVSIKRCVSSQRVTPRNDVTSPGESPS